MLIYDQRTQSLRHISDDELYHWKYIRREKKNGRWVYYYDDKEGAKHEAAVKQARTDATRAYAEKQKLYSKSAGVTSKQRADASAKEEKYRNQLGVLLKARKRQKVVSIPRRAVANGAVAVANMVSYLTRKRNRKKKTGGTTIDVSSNFVGYRR